MQPSANHSISAGPSTLFLPQHACRATWWATSALFAYYAATMARDLSLYDSGELALAAVQLGLGHPPGQPLHTLLGHALSRLPLLPPIVGVGLASALPAALTLIPATSLAQTLAGPAKAGAGRLLPWLIALMAVHASLWEPATRVEVYALSTFFAVWAAARIAVQGYYEREQATAPALLQAGLALGLCASVNPMIALCTGIALAPSLLARAVRRELPVRALGLAIAGGLVGLLPYAYVGITARRDDVFVWGAPRDRASLWHYLSLSDYTHKQHITGRVWAEHGRAWFAWALQHGLMPMVALGAFSLVLLGARTKLGRVAGPLLLLLMVATVSSNGVWNLDIPDYNGYLATPAWLTAAGAAAFCGYVHRQGYAVGAYLIAGLLAFSSVIMPPSVWSRTRHSDHLARQLAQRVLTEAPRGAIVIAEADHFASCLFYLQEVETQRPDVIVLAYGLGNSTWHWARIARLHPDLVTVALRGEGGKPGRVRRLLAANASRPVLVERLGIAEELGLRACAGGLYFRIGSACDVHRSLDPEVPRLLAHELARLGHGSPSADGAIAHTSYQLGEGLWRLGEPSAALTMLLAGVPKDLMPKGPTPITSVEGVHRLLRPHAPFARGAALGDPARNLLLISALLASADQARASLDYLLAAANDQLPEALAMLQPKR